MTDFLAPDHDIAKTETGLPGLDFMAHGGLPAQRLTLISGTAGSGKTILAAQFLARGIQAMDEAGVFVTFEETADDLRRNLYSFGWDVAQWEEDGQWAFVDASMNADDASVVSGDFDLSALLLRVVHAIEKVNARRVAVDSMAALFLQFQDQTIIRRELLRLSSALKKAGVTTVMTAERDEDYGGISRFGIEEYVADNVVILRHVLEAERRRRTVELFKMRGSSHQQGEVPFTIVGGAGIEVMPLGALKLAQASTDVRTPSGNADLDQMCGGGFFRDSVILTSGATGTGKTLLATEFVGAAAEQNERAIFFGFEESRAQLVRNATGWGRDFEAMEDAGLLTIHCTYPETRSLQQHLYDMMRRIEEVKPDRVAIDSISALERITSRQGFREFLLHLTAFVKQHQVTAFLTSTSPSLLGGVSTTGSRISTITDSILILRYVENEGEVQRGLAVLKMRGSEHDKDIRRFTIDGQGIRMGDSFDGLTGILTGDVRQVECPPDPA